MGLAISFDVDNTLVERDAAARSLLCTMFPDAHVEEAMRIDDSGRATPRLFAWLAGRGIPSRDPQVVARWFRAELPKFVRPDPLIIELVHRISAQHRCIVISNGGIGQRRKLEAAGVLHAFDSVLVPGEMRRRKPHASMFLAAARGLGVEPQQILHVGDDPIADVLGAGEAGCMTCWVARRRSFPEHLPPPNFMIQSLLELERILELPPKTEHDDAA